MPYVNAQDIINDALFRAGEIPGASEWDVKALDYLNRTYQAICTGASEFLPEFIEDWWWLRSNGAFLLLPVYKGGTVNVTKGSTVVTFNSDPPSSLANAYLRVEGHPDLFIIAEHSIGSDAVLDIAYTGETNATAAFKALHVRYTLPGPIAAIIGPIVAFRGRHTQIIGMSPERLDTLFPLQRLSAGMPVAFALESETTVRFSHAGLDDGSNLSTRLEFRFRPAVDKLENLTSSIPLLPLQWRQILSDTTTTYIMLDKNDDRATSVGQAARAGLQAMVRENRRRIAKIDGKAGKIITRQSSNSLNPRGQLQTESGFFIT